MCNLKHSMPKEIPIVFYNVSNSNFNFIIKELTGEFEGKFNCLGENTKNIT